jgi:hypothetical protein
MWPNVEDRAGYKQYVDGLMQACCVVQAEYILRQHHLDANGIPALFVIMNGGTTGIRVGPANGLFSAKHTFPEYGINKVASKSEPFRTARATPRSPTRVTQALASSTRDGRVLGNVNGGGGPTDETDVTFVSPFW